MTDANLDITVKTFKTTNKDDRSYVGVILRNDSFIPIMFMGVSTQEVRDKATNFYIESIRDNVDTFNFIDPRGDDGEAQSLMLGAFAPELPKGDLRKIQGKKWVHNPQTLHRMKCFERDMAGHLAKGYLEGRGPEWDSEGQPVAIRGKRGTVTDKEGYVHPFLNKRWVHKDGERLRVPKDDVESYLSRGYSKGYGKSVAPEDMPPVETEVTAREFSSTDEEWNTPPAAEVHENTETVEA